MSELRGPAFDTSGPEPHDWIWSWIFRNSCHEKIRIESWTRANFHGYSFQYIFNANESLPIFVEGNGASKRLSFTWQAWHSDAQPPNPLIMWCASKSDHTPEERREYRRNDPCGGDNDYRVNKDNWIELHVPILPPPGRPYRRPSVSHGAETYHGSGR